MVEKKIIDIGTTKAGPYSHGIKVDNLIFISGQVPSPEAETIKEQTLSSLNKIKIILENADSKVSDIVKITVYLKNINDFKEMNEAYMEFFNQNGVDEKYPARSTIQATLPIVKFLIEIDAIAVI